MCEIPVEVANEETVVRGIFHPYHTKGSKLHWNAFRPPPGRADVSVMRHDYLGPEECRVRAKVIGGTDKQYRGLASIRVRSVRDVGPDVVDSRDQFLGHADIMHIHVVQAGEPPDDGHAFELLRETCKRLVKAALFAAEPAS